MILLSTPGKVQALIIEGQGGIPGQVQLTSTGWFSDTVGISDRVIITGVGYNQESNIQFTHTLQNSIFIYSFGDRIGELQIQGIAFNQLCDSKASGTGISDLINYYAQNRVAVTGQPLRVTIGGSQIIKGFLVGCKVSTLSTEFMTMQFTLNMVALPIDNQGGST